MLIITGTIAYDYIMDFPGRFGDHILPEKIHNINLSFIVDKFERRRGGTAGNISYTLGLFKTPHTLFSVAGKDFEEYKKAFEKIGINTSKVIIDEKKYTSTGFAMTDNKDNQIWGFFYGATDGIEKLELNKIAQKNDLVYVGPAGAKGSMSFVKQSVDLGNEYFFDPGFILTQVSDDDLTFGAQYALYIAGNDYEINMLQKRVKNWEEIIKTKTIITTLGEKGATIQNQDKTYTIAPAQPKEVIDPTGAGDAFRAGFLAGISLSLDTQTAGQMGAVAASFAIENYGTQEHIFTNEVFTKRYQDTYNVSLVLER